MSLSFSETVLYLTLYSIMGWICEVVYCSVPKRKFINRGFLYGPYCPIYGVGAMLITAVTLPLKQSPVLVFIASFFLTTGLEYMTSWLMEALFQIRWWDYSKHRFNLHGRVCLLNSVLFGFMGLAATYLIHPVCALMIGTIPSAFQRAVASAVIAVFLLDLITTLNTLLKLTDKLQTLRGYVAELEKYNDEYAWFSAGDLSGSIIRLRAICENDEGNAKLAGILSRLETVVQKTAEARHVIAFPNLRPKGFGTALENLRSAWDHRVELRKESWKARAWNPDNRQGNAPAGGARAAASPFAGKLHFYKLVWVFVVASLLGYVAETFFCMVSSGVVESRQGLLYGPFNQVYGFGAVFMVLLLTPLAKQKDRWIFSGGAVIGGAFEYLCSYVQEKISGTISWDYSGQVLSIGGRTNLGYMLFWGALGLLFMKWVYPALSRLIERIPKRQVLFFSWVFILLFSADVVLSGSAVYRWSNRLRGVPPANAYEVFLDSKYTDERLEEIYPNMIMLKQR